MASSSKVSVGLDEGLLVGLEVIGLGVVLTVGDAVTIASVPTAEGDEVTFVDVETLCESLPLGEFKLFGLFVCFFGCKVGLFVIFGYSQLFLEDLLLLDFDFGDFVLTDFSDLMLLDAAFSDLLLTLLVTSRD